YDGLAVPQRTRPRHLLSGLLRCACCGGAYTVKSRDILACSRRREGGPAACPNGATIRRAEIEARVLDGIRAVFDTPGRMAEFVRLYHAERARLAADGRRRQGDIAKRNARLAAEITRLVDAIADGLDTPGVRERLHRVEAERAGLAAEL